ncbi:MAG TPA: fused uroporphyrinogen-III synthase HemD/membrane protein HemX [Methylococcus sp.]|nr:fused uroporphyrinogen-III synthase HemD/membrane protein HemX [Methylococcus sp.]
MTLSFRKPLAGLGILVTRPADQAEGLCHLIEQAGGTALRFPLLEIHPSKRAGEGVARLRRPQDWDWFIFVSANAVRQAQEHDALPRREPGNFPRLAAIGAATAEALAAAGAAVDLVPESEFNSEALLAMPELQEVAGRRILIVRGEGGRETLKEELVNRGASVEYAELYRREPSTADVEPLLRAWQAGQIQVLTLTSGAALDHLHRLIPAEYRELVLKTPLVVLSERLRRRALALGFAQVAVTTSASDRGLLETLSEKAGAWRSTREMSNDGDTPLLDDAREETHVSGPPADPSEPPPHPQSTSETVAKVKPARKSRLLAWIGYATLSAILLLATAGYFLLQELRSKQEGLGGELSKGDQHMLELSHQISGLQAQVASLHSQIAALQTEISTEDNKLERMLGEQSQAFGEKLNLTRTALEESIQRIQRQLNRTRGDLLIADAEYLLSVANQKLHLIGDVKAALAAMQAADQRLLESGDPSVFKIREALATEINQIEDFQAPDVVGLSARLLAIESKVRDLPLFLPHAEKAKESAEPGKSRSPESGDMLDSTLQQLKDLVTVRRTDRPVQAVLTPEEVAGLREILLLKLEMARASLLRGDDELYRTNLASARAWIDEHFDREAASVKDIVAELEALSGVRLRVPFPDISTSLSLLRNIEKLRLETEEKAPAGVEGAKSHIGQPSAGTTGDTP